MLYDPVKVVTDELERHGVTEWDVDRHSNHPKIRFVFNGQKQMFVVAGTPSDRHAWENSLTDLRKRMGVKRLVNKSSTPKRKRNKTEIRTSMAELSFTVQPNALSALSVVADRLRAEINDAWQAGERAFLTGDSGMAPLKWPVHLSQAYVAGWWAMHALVNEL